MVLMHGALWRLYSEKQLNYTNAIGNIENWNWKFDRESNILVNKVTNFSHLIKYYLEYTENRVGTYTIVGILTH